ncbi:ribonuclease H-like protein [Meredithblackwellia eburnea MCA 4105]
MGKLAVSTSSTAIASSNWAKLKQKLNPAAATSASASSSPSKSLKRKRSDDEPSSSKGKGKQREEDTSEGAPLPDSANGAGKRNRRAGDVMSVLNGGTEKWQSETGQYLAIDCEMVGVGPSGVESTLARVSIVNYHGVVVLDEFVRPREKVTDYRTWVSGIREENLRNAPSFSEVQKQVSALIKDRILIGHAISNDTQVLLLSHPRHMTRDTAKYAPLQQLARTKMPGLKALARLCLGVDIQKGEHSSVRSSFVSLLSSCKVNSIPKLRHAQVDDARATMAIYRSQKTQWEDSLRTHSKPKLVTTSTPTLLALDLTKLSSASSSTKVKGSNRHSAKSMGLAATLRHVKSLADGSDSGGEEEDEEIAEAKEEEKRKKRKLEVEEELVLGFDFARPEKGNAATEDVKEKEKVQQAGKKKEKKKEKVPGRAFKGDREKRPKSKEGWWEE